MSIHHSSNRAIAFYFLQVHQMRLCKLKESLIYFSANPSSHDCLSLSLPHNTGTEELVFGKKDDAALAAAAAASEKELNVTLSS